MTSKLNTAQKQYCYKSSKIGLHMQCKRKQCLMDMQSETYNLTVCDKLLCKNKGPLTVSDNHCYLWVVNGKMSSFHSLQFPSSRPIPISFSFPIPIPVKLA